MLTVPWVEIGTKAAQIPEKEYINGIFVAVEYCVTRVFKMRAAYKITCKISATFLLSFRGEFARPADFTCE